MLATKVNGLKYLCLISFISALGGLMFGYITAVIAGAAPFVTKAFDLTQLQVSLLVSSMLIAAGLGALMSGSLVDTLGRRFTIFLCALIYILGSWLAASAQHIDLLIFSRLLCGIALGICSFTVPMYISEVAPESHRGKFVMINSMALTGGMLLGYVINLIYAPSEDWRAMFAFAIFPATLLAIGILLLPESPRWLILKNKCQQASKILQTLRSIEHVKEEINAIKQSIISQQTTWRALLQPYALKMLGIGLALAIMQQITGINTILYYAPNLFSAAGFHGKALYYIPLLMGGINFIMTGVALVCVDKFGRRVLLTKGLQWMIASLVVMISLMGVKNQSILISSTMILACITFVGSYAVSLGCLFWLLIAEIFPLHMRAKSMGIITAANWFANFIIILSFLPMLHIFGIQLTFSFYALACIMSLVFAYKFIPETKSVTLEQIQENLIAGKRMREVGAPI